MLIDALLYMSYSIASTIICQILGNVSVADDLEFLLKQPWHSETTLRQVLNRVVVSCGQLMLAFKRMNGLV